jgi:pterin-4a-carbinolamine dehydratase
MNSSGYPIVSLQRQLNRDAVHWGVAYLAEVANHHSDIAIEWNRVRLTLSTHSDGGLTAADVALAGRIDALG